MLAKDDMEYRIKQTSLDPENHRLTVIKDGFTVLEEDFENFVAVTYRIETLRQDARRAIFNILEEKVPDTLRSV